MFDADITYDTSPHVHPRPDERDAAILSARLALRDASPYQGPRVGDWVRMEDGTASRITYVWDFSDGCHVQTGGAASGSFYLCDNGFQSYSGGLDPGIPASSLTLTDETMPGVVWFFHHNFPGAGRGVYFTVQERVWVRRSQ